MPSPLPRRNRWVRSSLASPAMSAFPVIQAGRLPHHPFRGLLSVYSRYGLHTRQVPCRTLYTEGFSRFVTSTTAPIATGWSDSCRVGIAPTERPCLCTAHWNSLGYAKERVHATESSALGMHKQMSALDRLLRPGIAVCSPRMSLSWSFASCSKLAVAPVGQASGFSSPSKVGTNSETVGWMCIARRNTG